MKVFLRSFTSSYSLQWRDISVGHFATLLWSCLLHLWRIWSTIWSCSLHCQVWDCTLAYISVQTVCVQSVVPERSQTITTCSFCPAEATVIVCLLFWFGDSFDDEYFFFVWDRVVRLLCSVCVPSFASWSACSLPATSQWAGIHWRATLCMVLSLFSAWAISRLFLF